MPRPQQPSGANRFHLLFILAFVALSFWVSSAHSDNKPAAKPRAGNSSKTASDGADSGIANVVFDEALAKAASIQQFDNEAFVTALQSVAPRFPVLTPALTPDKA